jgi:hypothetical protein
MHTAEQLDRAMFTVRIAGQEADRSDVFPNWMATDRLGVVVWQPYGAVGASHLIQLAITCFYDFRPERRGPNGIYPEIYLFHVGGRHGDHSPYDFWPARKEVFTSDNPRHVLDQINDKGITRLAVPDGSRVPVTHQAKERETALDRVSSAFAYSPIGQTPGGDLVIAGLTPQTEMNARNTFQPDRLLARLGSSLLANFKENDSGYGDRLRARMNEAPAGERASAQRRRNEVANAGCVRESYRRIEVDLALDMLAPSGRRPGKPHRERGWCWA